ncbi:hypothetical protein EVAR_59205_1 [Eumeta japonica]|uniref:Uncharacterized protein n=1 Tax=Eumeta variegata TaxID=151549 RepID=A0A4C1ZG29_EUMVA|nr:hypothetical protein EVAR_59205_1 [Eumeta japonica]
MLREKARSMGKMKYIYISEDEAWNSYLVLSASVFPLSRREQVKVSSDTTLTRLRPLVLYGVWMQMKLHSLQLHTFTGRPRWFGSGAFQIKQARSYYCEHLRRTDSFVREVCRECSSHLREL